MSDFSRNIWMYWDSGLKSAPELVRVCVNSWKKKTQLGLYVYWTPET